MCLEGGSAQSRHPVDISNAAVSARIADIRRKRETRGCSNSHSADEADLYKDFGKVRFDVNLPVKNGRLCSGHKPTVKPTIGLPHRT